MRKKCNFLLLFLLLAKLLLAQPENRIWFTEPAQLFEEAFPLGNGRIGAMLYGGTGAERISLNEASLWAGGPVNPAMNPTAAAFLPKVRAALFREDYRAADSLMHFMQGSFSQSYAPLGNLFLDWNQSGVTAYQRSLDISTATASISYQHQNTRYKREAFLSHPDQVLVIRLRSEGQERLNFTVRANSLLPYRTSTSNAELLMRGIAPSHAEPNYRGNMANALKFDTANCMRFAMRVLVQHTDGQLQLGDSSIRVTNAREAVLLVTIATSFNGFQHNPGTNGKDELLASKQQLEAARTKTIEQLQQAHRKDYATYFNRVSLQLEGPARQHLPINERLKRFAAGEADNGLAALYFQFGRYLLISASRTPGIPANLQGIWNEALRPPWSSNYTTNINTEMNYWLAEVTNLSEMHLPLFSFLANLRKTGTITAQQYYNAGGWMLHHNSDIWAMTNPVGDFGHGDPVWANWMMGAAWLSTHIWEHAAFTGDTVFLRNNYELLKEAAVFCRDFMVRDAAGKWITAPSTSPENKYISPSGYQGATLYGGTADLAMIRELFYTVIRAAEVLGKDKAFCTSLKTILNELHPYKIGAKGNLQEWYFDWEDAEPHHRHISHLFGLFPGRSISVTKTPELAAAVRRSLELRTNNGTGWSIAWKINLWARLKDTAMAYDALKKILTYYPARANETRYAGGGTYPNLLDAHPPFQIDGNFGASAGIAEMLLQSQEGDIDLLPCLPASWPNGAVTGLRARGGHTIDLAWKKGKLTYAKVVSDNAVSKTIKYQGNSWKHSGKTWVWGRKP